MSPYTRVFGREIDLEKFALDTARMLLLPPLREMYCGAWRQRDRRWATVPKAADQYADAAIAIAERFKISDRRQAVRLAWSLMGHWAAEIAPAALYRRELFYRAVKADPILDIEARALIKGFPLLTDGADLGGVTDSPRTEPVEPTH